MMSYYRPLVKIVNITIKRNLLELYSISLFLIIKIILYLLEYKFFMFACK